MLWMPRLAYDGFVAVSLFLSFFLSSFLICSHGAIGAINGAIRKRNQLLLC
jgi:hypothetical protein